MQEMMKNRAKALLADGTVNRVIGWRRGEFSYDITPAVFETAEEIERDFVWDAFCGANVSKYLIRDSAKGQEAGRILAGAVTRKTSLGFYSAESMRKLQENLLNRIIFCNFVPRILCVCTCVVHIRVREVAK